MSTIARALIEVRESIKKAGIESYALDARLLLSHVTGLSKTELILQDDRELDFDEVKLLKELTAKRITGYPMAYILGYKEFWGLKLKVSPDVLIPRPDTETLVDCALKVNFSSVLDLGTGSGAVILALKHERPSALCTASDLSDGALSIASCNAHNLSLDVEFLKSSWLDAFAGRHFDLIVSNPPYIRNDDEHLNKTSLPFEPITALTSGADGLDDIRIIVKDSRDHLNKKGYLMLEHGYDQGAGVREILTEYGFEAVHTVKDLGDNDRVSIGQYNL